MSNQLWGQNGSTQKDTLDSFSRYWLKFWGFFYSKPQWIHVSNFYLFILFPRYCNFFLDNNHVLSPIIRNYIYDRSSNTVLKVTLNIFTQSILLWKNQYKNVKSHIFNPKKWINILQCQNLYFPKNRFDALKK